jgi:hypothetical protein
LRFDPTGRTDKVKAIVEKACAGKTLTADEQAILRGVGKHWSHPRTSSTSLQSLPPFWPEMPHVCTPCPGS